MKDKFQKWCSIIKNCLINLFHCWLTLSFIYHIYWSIKTENDTSKFKLSLFVVLIAGLYCYYKCYISKISDDTEHFLLLGDRKK